MITEAGHIVEGFFALGRSSEVFYEKEFPKTGKSTPDAKWKLSAFLRYKPYSINYNLPWKKMR